VAEAFSGVEAELIAATNLKTAVTGVLVGCVMKLGKAPLSITRFTTIAELQANEADFTGYASEAVVWSANSVDDLGRVELLGVVGEFRPTGTTITNEISYAWVENGAGDKICAWQVEDGPVQMASALDSYQATPRLRPSLAGDAVEIS
jgi:hypothetical protein